MPDFDDFLDFGDDMYWNEELGVDVRTLPRAEQLQWMQSVIEQGRQAARYAAKMEAETLADFEPLVASWYAEIAALSSINWRTVLQQRRLDELLDHVDALPEFVRRMGPPPWRGRVMDVSVV